MRALCVTTNYARSAGDYHSPWLRELIARLGRRGVETDVLAPAFRGLGDHAIDGVPVYRFRYAPARWETLTHESGAPNKLRSNPLYWGLLPLYLASGTAAAIRRASGCPYSVIHVHWPVPQAVFGFAARKRCKARLVLTFYGADVSLARKFPWLRGVLRRMVVGADAVTAISRHTGSLVQEMTGVEPVVIPYGVRWPERRPDSTERDPLHVLAVGRLIERKGYPVLIEAMDRIRRRFPGAHLTIVGEGRQRPALEAMVERLGLSGVVTLAGRVSDEELDRLYRSAGVFVLPAIVDKGGDTEGLGVVLLEALSYGVPVVASGIGGILDIVEDGETGLLVPPGDPDALAEAVSRLLADRAMARALAERGAEVNRERFDWERIADAYLGVYLGEQSAAGGRDHG